MSIYIYIMVAHAWPEENCITLEAWIIPLGLISRIDAQVNLGVSPGA